MKGKDFQEATFFTEAQGLTAQSHKIMQPSKAVERLETNDRLRSLDF
jgi:hypothetical protein